MSSAWRARMVLVVPVVLCALLLIWLHVWMIGRVFFGHQHDWTPAIATVVSVEDNIGARTPNARIEYAFFVETQDVKGTDELDRSVAIGIEPGDQVEILYNPQDPSEHVLAQDGGADMNQLVVLLLADGVLVIAAIVGYVKHRKTV